MRNRKLIVACSCIAGVVFGGTDLVDFRTDRTAEGWELGDTVFNKDRGRKFVADGGAIQSPAAASAVTSATVVVSFTVSNSPVPRFHAFAGPDPDNLTARATWTNRVVNIFTTNRLTFAASEDVRVLRVVVDRNANEKTNPFVVSVARTGVGEIAAPTDPGNDPAATNVLDAAVRLSACPAGYWRETFNACTNLFLSTSNTADWTNGLSLAPWCAYEDGTPPTKILRNLGKQTTEGLYAYWDGTRTRSYALGMNVGSSANTYVCGLALTNDTPYRLHDLTLAYTGRQYGFKNTAAQTLAVEWRLGAMKDGVLADDAWSTTDALTFTTPAVGRGDELVSGATQLEARVSAPLTGLIVVPGGVLWLRWRRERASNVAALGIDDIRLEWQRSRLPTLILIR